MRGTDALRLGTAMLTATLTACGGGGGGGDGGGGPLTDADFVGTYFRVGVGGSFSPASITGATGTITADGAGAAVLAGTTNLDGVIFGPASAGLLYDVGADGTLELRSDTGPFRSGGLTGDGACALLATTTDGAQPRVDILLRKAGTHDLASLSGLYHLAGMSGLTDSNVQAFTGPVLFDGAGRAFFTGLTSNVMGGIETINVDCTYTLDADGTSVLDLSGTPFPGGVVEGGAAAVWGGPVSAGNAGTLFAAVRAATTATNATFSGEYWAVSLVCEFGSSTYAARIGTANANGSGEVTFLLATNREGTITPPETSLATYTVAADGALTLSGESDLRGGISADGRFAVLGGGTTEGSNPSFLVLRRK